MPADGFAIGLIVCFVVLVVLFGTTTGYAPSGTVLPANAYELWSNIHVMAFVGFGVLMSFSANISLTATALSLVLGSVASLWYILNRGLWSQAIGFVRPLVTVVVGGEQLVRADFAVTSVLVAFGAVIGRVTSLQALLMTVIHILFYSINESIGEQRIRMSDPGGSMTIHLFGGLFGAACALVLDRQASRKDIGGATVTTHVSNARALLGTLFLFCYFPSFNCFFSTIDLSTAADQLPTCVVNTYLSLLTSSLLAVVLSRFFNEGQTLIADVQNSVLAGGVIIAATSNLVVYPFGAIAIGSLGAFAATFGVNKIRPSLQTSIGLRLTRPVLTVHALPGFLGGLISALATGAAVVNAQYQLPADIWRGYTLDFSQSQVAARQLGYLFLTVGMSIVGGAFAGLIMRIAPSLQRFYTDSEEWEL